MSYLRIEDVVSLLSYADPDIELQERLLSGLLSEAHAVTAFEWLNNRLIGHLRSQQQVDARSKLERMLQQL